MPSKKDTIKLLEEIADMLELKGENKFKIQAYRIGAGSIKKIETDFDNVVKQKELNKIKGIGAGLQKIIYEFYNTNESALYKSLREEIPDGLEQLLKIKGLNPAKIKLINSELGIKNLEELEEAAKKNLLVNIKGFGENLQEKILTGIKEHKIYSHYILLNDALRLSDEFLNKISNFYSVKLIDKSGELRRKSEIISQLIFVALTSNQNAFYNDLNKIYNFKKLKDKILIEELSDIPVYIFIASDKNEYYRQLFLTTGSEEFVKTLNSKKIEGNSEEEIFSTSKMPFIIPEMREKEYFDQKNKSLLKNSNLTFDDFKGLLHFHTTFSDGKNTLAEMNKAAEEIGFSYAAVNDHSKSAFYANGMDEKRVLQQRKEVKQINSKSKAALFAGIEVDILVNGDLDYNDEILSGFDFVVASVHSRFNLDEREMTRRIIKAVENPFVDVLAHPSGRLLLSRNPYKFDVKKVIDACFVNNVAIEINSSPKRLDLEWRWVYYAREKGCLFSINPDAHTISEISYLIYGIMMGRKAGLQPEEVINCFNLNKFKKFLNRKFKRNFSS
ncbi:MAG: PHP domain-containing protein [Ignavibacteriaceae bacterium]